MPTNLYGPGDNYDLQIEPRRGGDAGQGASSAKQTRRQAVEIWGTGTPRREFLYVDDMADALVFLMQHYSGEPHVNVGTGTDITIRDLAELVAKVAGWQGEFVYDPSKPDGTPRKVMDVSRLRGLGWPAKTPPRGVSRGVPMVREHVAGQGSGGDLAG